MMRPLPAIVMLVLLACQPTDGVPDSYQPIVINAILVANQTLQVFTIQWAPTQAVPDPSGGPSPADINLWIVSSDNDSTPVVAGPVRGRFTAGLPPKPGSTYLLRGTILGSPIFARTTVPSLVINHPREGDTLHTAVLDPNNGGLVPVFLDVAATGALAYEVSGDGLFVLQSNSSGFGALVSLAYLEFPPPVVSTDDMTAAVHRITVTAFDSSTSSFLGFVKVLQDPPFFGRTTVVGGIATSNISGALGIFGSSTPASANYVVAR